MTEKEICTKCRGMGYSLCSECKGEAKCQHCGGSGTETFEGRVIKCIFCQATGTCRACEGQGRKEGVCYACNGLGYWDKHLKTLVKQEVLQAIAYFIERQRLVAQAMIDLGLDLEEVGKYKALGWLSGGGADTSKLDQLYESETDPQEREKLAVLRRMAIRPFLPAAGTWQDKDNNEWEYHLHGGGCMLVNPQSREVIDWDCPNVFAFDPLFFAQHLEWQLLSSERQEQLQSTRQWIQQVSLARPIANLTVAIDNLVREMSNEGLINQDWTLSHYSPGKR